MSDLPLQVYIDAEGDDAGPGAHAHPFRTPGRALRWLAERRHAVSASAETGDLSLIFLPGLHRVDSSVMIGPEHSGCPTSRTIMLGAGNPILTAASTLRATRPADEHCRNAGQLSAVSIPGIEGLPGDLGDLGYRRAIPLAPPFVLRDGRPLNWLRFPEEGWFGTHVQQRSAPDLIRLYADASTLAELRGEPAIWVEVLFGDDWNWHVARLRSIDFENGGVEISLPQSVSKVLGTRFKLAFLNRRGGLAERDGCWLDPENRQLVFQSTDAHVELCAMPGHIVRVDAASHISFEGLRFQGGLGCAIHAVGVENLVVDQCSLRAFASGGLHLEGRRIRVLDTEALDIGTTGIRLEAGDAATLTDGESVVENCSVSRWGWRKPVYEPAVRVRGVGSIVRDCAFSDGPHMAVELFGNDHLVEGCRFDDVVNRIDDMGAIYLNMGEYPLQRGHRIRRNLFRRIGRGRHLASGVYSDRASNGVTISENLFHEIRSFGSGEAAGIHVNCGSNIVVEANLFVECDQALKMDFYLARWGDIDLPLMQVARKHALESLARGVPHLSAYPELAELAALSLTLPDTNVVRRNTAIGRPSAQETFQLISPIPGLAETVDNRLALDDARLLSALDHPWSHLFAKADTIAKLFASIDVLNGAWGIALFEASGTSDRQT